MRQVLLYYYAEDKGEGKLFFFAKPEKTNSHGIANGVFKNNEQRKIRASQCLPKKTMARKPRHF